MISDSQARELAGQRNDSAPLTVICLSKYLGNRDHQLDRMLRSLFRTAHDPTRLDVLVRIDLDDDAEHFLRLQQAHPSVRFIAGGSYGPRAFHRLYQNLFTRIGMSSKVVMSATDDGVFTYRGWDSRLLELDGMFLGGELPFDKVTTRTFMTLTSPGVYAYDANNYWFLSTKLLDKLSCLTDDDPTFTAFGESMAVDSWFSALVATAWEEFGENIYVQLPRIAERKGVVAWHRNPATRELRQKALESLMGEPNRQVRIRLLSEVFGWDRSIPEKRLDIFERQATYG